MYRSRVLPSLVVATAMSLCVWGCGGNEATEFPAGLEPLEENTAPAPTGTMTDPFPEEVVLVSGSAPRYEWVHLHGFIHAPLERVYDALSEPEACVDHRKVTRHTITLDTEPDYDRSFLTHNEVDDIITVEFDLNWRFGLVDGSNDRPDLIGGTFSKTFGTTFISLLRGSIVARRIDDVTTEVELIEHINAATGGSDDIISFMTDYFANAVALSHGDPLPTY